MPRRNRTPKHQPYVDTDTCRTKRRFSSEKAALAAAELLELQGGHGFSVYKCERCAGWHLSSNKLT